MEPHARRCPVQILCLLKIITAAYCLPYLFVYLFIYLFIYLLLKKTSTPKNRLLAVYKQKIRNYHIQFIPDFYNQLQWKFS